MELKKYQRRVVDDVERYLQRVSHYRQQAQTRHASLDAWKDLGLGAYAEQENGLGQDFPSFCIKVPTGGGKTLLATQILGSAFRTILQDRNGAGLVLWVVPSSQIYRDTLRRLKDRNDMYRLMLEHAVSRRIEIWEKGEINRLSPVKLQECLNILVVQLASTNRETREQLKFFSDSGGNIVSNFPAEDDFEANRKLKREFPNLDMIVDDESTGQHLLKTSVGNLVRICRPAVILDEGHKATSELARSTLRTFNASLIVELSATPRRGTNIVSRVTGRELLDEEMIKLPLNIATSGQKSWQDVLTQARDKRLALARKAAQHTLAAGEGRHIRPIVLVQVERTGRDQRDAGLIHSEDVKTYLVERLGISGDAIKIKTAETDGLEDIDLMDPLCPVEWIITKSALQEGWDCPFAYILVSLNNTGSGQSMTQLVGRVLRQPYQERTPLAELNESYVYCLRKRAWEISKEVKNALEKEGYEGDGASLIVDASDGQVLPEREVRIREDFLSLYNKPYEGKIYLPRFCVKEGNRYEPLDYFRHLLKRVDVTRFPFGKIDWSLASEITEAKDRFYRLTLGQDMLQQREVAVDILESDASVQSWIVASLAFQYLSHKQLRHVVRQVCERLLQTHLQCALQDRLGLVKFVVRDKIQAFVEEQLDRQTEAAFVELYESGKLMFYLECAECRFEIPATITVRTARPLAHDDGSPIAKSLFDYVEHESQNEYERAVALCLDRNADVLWWYRNLVGADQFAIQGYKRNRIHPDFVVQNGTKEKPEHRVLVIESKGKHLEGNPDTTYKRNVAAYFNKVGKKVPWQQLGKDFRDHVFRFQILDEAQSLGRDWRDELRSFLAR